MSDQSTWRHSNRVSERRQDQGLARFRTMAMDAFNKMGLGEAPRRRVKETPREYMENTIDEVLGQTAHLPAMQTYAGLSARDLSPSSPNDEGIERFSSKVFADAVSAMRASGPGTGPARVIETKDESGRPIRMFAGDQGDVWAPFRAPPVVTRIDPKLANRGRCKAAGVPYPVKSGLTLMSDGSFSDGSRRVSAEGALRAFA